MVPWPLEACRPPLQPGVGGGEPRTVSTRRGNRLTWYDLMRALNEPISWWGWHGWGGQPVPLSITELIQAGTMPPELAALFWLSLERRASLILAADPPSAGKSTILTALLTFLPPEARAYFTRGWGETFDLPPVSDDAPTYILVNEISDELPVYSWGPYVVRVFELLAEGYPLGSTMHADTVEETIALLEEELGVPRRHLAHLTFIATVGMAHAGGRIRRRINEVALLGAGEGADDDLSVIPVSSWDAEDDSFRVLKRRESAGAVARTLGLPVVQLRREMGRRGRFLEGLVRDGVLDQMAVHDAIAQYRSDFTPGGAPG